VRFLVAAGLLLASCYDPKAPANAPCPDGECPTGQACVGGVCREGMEMDSGIEDDGSVDPGAIDAPAGACIAGDGECLVSCVDSDPDCMTTCGDGRCVGNAGELCGNCAADCATKTIVCGNGACEQGEAPDCYADCGPETWLWLAMEQDAIDRINAKRTGGTTCPGGNPAMAPALTKSAALVPTVHEWVWEIAHQNVLTTGGGSCNGRTNADRQIPADFDTYVQSRGHASVEAAVNSWFASSTICPSLMATTRTKIAVGVAFDVAKGYVVVLE